MDGSQLLSSSRWFFSLVSSVQLSLSRVQLFATSWTAACQASYTKCPAKISNMSKAHTSLSAPPSPFYKFNTSAPPNECPFPLLAITHSTLPGACAQFLPLSHIQWTSPFRNTELFLKSSSCHLYRHSLNLHFPVSPLALTAPNASSCSDPNTEINRSKLRFFFTLRTVVCLFIFGCAGSLLLCEKFL